VGEKNATLQKKSGRVSASILGCVGGLLGITCHRHVRAKKKKEGERERDGERGWDLVALGGWQLLARCEEDWHRGLVSSIEA